ncbi:MAG TPA: GNAT family N-acetyltransferase [Dehalococcoidia bacterium]
MQIREATTGDTQRILELMEELMAPPGARPPDYSNEGATARIHYSIVSPDATVLLAEVDGVVVGLATLYVTFPAVRYGLRCWLEDLVTTSSMRSVGVGKTLLDAATDWARARGCTHLMLDSGNARNDSHRFYLREGMDQHSITFQRPLS